jgi:UDP-N-acetylmuramoyl-tripeptide--D-alanyl-D-alanine ligase
LGVSEESAEQRIQGVSTDTRTIAKDTLFVPLVGEKFNGHDYVSEAVRKGAAAVLWQEDQGEPPTGVVAVIVDDTLSALQRLAARYRESLGIKVIGITGSNGKTTTKDMVAAVLSARYKVHKTEGNLNNHIGLPRTLLALDPDTEFAVVEMGMSGFGEIELLSRIASPDAAVITNIGEAHMLQLGSRDGIANAKLEILCGLKEDGLFVYPGEEPLIARHVGDAVRPKSYRELRFGTGSDNDAALKSVRIGDATTSFQIQGSDVEFVIPLLGRHNAMNALAAILVGREFGLEDRKIAQALRDMLPTGMRIERVKGKQGVTILNDAYNASPASMKAALELLAQSASYRRKFAVLGDMLELGPDERKFHREIGLTLTPDSVDFIYTYGALGAEIAAAAADRFAAGRVASFSTKEEIVERILQTAAAGDVVLVKASRGMKLEDVVDGLREES